MDGTIEFLGKVGLVKKYWGPMSKSHFRDKALRELPLTVHFSFHALPIFNSGAKDFLLCVVAYLDACKELLTISPLEQGSMGCPTDFSISALDMLDTGLFLGIVPPQSLSPPCLRYSKV